MNEEKTMSFDDLNATISENEAASRGDLFEPTDVIDPFETVDNLVNGDEDEEPSSEGEDSSTGASDIASDDDNSAGEKSEDNNQPVGADAKEDLDDEYLASGKVDSIPYPRFKKVNEKGQALQAENEKLKAELEQLRKGQQSQSENPSGSQPPDGQQQQQQPSVNAKIKELSRDYTEAILDGDGERAAELNAELIELQAALSAEKATASIMEREAANGVNKVVDGILDRHADYFNDQLNLDQFDVVKNHYIVREGMSLTDALHAAETRIFGEEKEKKAEENESDNGIISEAEKERIRSEQRQRAIAKNVKAAKSQPPSISVGVGNRSPATAKSDSRNGLTITDKELKTMSKQDLAKARGDVF